MRAAFRRAGRSDKIPWNIQLNDPYFNALEYVYRLSSINGSTAKISSDGKLRAVISLEDPGVPNWLDPAGYTEGGTYGRWYDADTTRRRSSIVCPWRSSGNICRTTHPR
jgi:hypothetical protein